MTGVESLSYIEGIDPKIKPKLALHFYGVLSYRLNKSLYTVHVGTGCSLSRTPQEMPLHDPPYFSLHSAMAASYEAFASTVCASRFLSASVVRFS